MGQCQYMQNGMRYNTVHVSICVCVLLKWPAYKITNYIPCQDNLQCFPVYELYILILGPDPYHRPPSCTVIYQNVTNIALILIQVIKHGGGNLHTHTPNHKSNRHDLEAHKSILEFCVYAK